jgi:hypothetical protein
VTILVILFAVLVLGNADDADDFFEAKVRPLLVEKCQECHRGEAPKGRLDLTSRASLLKGGRSGPAAVSGQPDESLLIEVVHYDSEPRMPPKARLSDPEVAALTRWVELGLPWPGGQGGASSGSTERTGVKARHWAFQPVAQVAPPEVKDPTWARTPIDRFVLARLESEGLTPSPPADRRTLIRRMTRDMTGLPPTAEEVDAFVRDDRPDAIECLVDRLLSSPQYGEQWARHWLDVARYSDTKGYVYAREERFWVHAWAYRDWVVRALNDDMPFDRFVTLQVAADRVAPDDRASLAAMGFLTLGRRFLGVTHDIIDDRIDVVARGMLGLTVACARCHDHKFDPIPTSDYYALYGIFRNSSERMVEVGTSDASEAFRAGLAERQVKLEKRLSEERVAAADRVRARVTDYLTAQLELQKYPEEGFDQILAKEDLIPASVRRWRDVLAAASHRGDPVFRAWAEFSRLKPAEFGGRAADVCRFLDEAGPDVVDAAVAAAFTSPPATMREVAERYGAVFQEACQNEDHESLRRVLFGPESPCEVPDEPIVNIEAFFPTSTTEELWKLQGEVDRWLIRSSEAPPCAAVLVDRTSTVEARVFRRGNPANQGEVAPRRFLEVLAGLDAKPFTDGSGRLDLARAIVAPGNPLTARVIVNRLWSHHFGAGLVHTPSDFGLRAEPPTHPDLLDWLASRFMAEGWGLKWLHRMILLSASYQQASVGGTDPTQGGRATQLDPENRLLWRGPRHRISFEEMRDALLASSGELDLSMGGKPVDVLAAPFSTRRTLYGLVDRQEFPAVLRVFDFANPDLHVPQRGETIVPQQALFLMNHPFLVGRARAIAARPEVLAAPSHEDRVRTLFQLLYQREPSRPQIDMALALVKGAEAEVVPAPPANARDWRYGYGEVDPSVGRLKKFEELPYFGEGAWQGGPSWPDAMLGWLRLDAEGGHPGNDKAHAVVRRWVAPREGVVSIRSTLIHEVKQGDGILAWLIGGQQGTLKTAAVHNEREDFSTGSVVVKVGDTIDFVVDLRDNLNSDQFLWVPVISYEDGSRTWDAARDFSGPPIVRLDTWEQLAHALLMANEFAFDD